MYWFKILFIIIVAIILTILFYLIPNKSNFPKKIMIPLIVSLIIKYSIGDLDRGYQWTVSDIYYWMMILDIPFIVVAFMDAKYQML